MNDLIFSANAVFPIILLVLLGWVLKKIKLLSKDFLSVANKLTFNVLLPVLLFNNVYALESFSSIDWVFVSYAVIAILIVFALAVPLSALVTKKRSQRGVIIQACFRSNYAIIGVPLATQLFGAQGAAAASILSAFSIPLFNALAVITLSIYNGKSESSEKPDFKKILLGIVKNPLIIGVACGLLALGIRSLLVNLNISFRLSDVGFLQTALKYVGGSATPLALIVLGGQFEFSAVSSLKKQIIFATSARIVVVPLITLTVALLLFPNMGGECYASFIALFGTPVAVSSAIMAREMDCDGDLAGQLVVWTTLLSAITLFVTITIFRFIGVF